MFSRHVLIFLAVVLAVAIVNATSDEKLHQLNNIRGVIMGSFKVTSRDCYTKAANACVQYWLNREKTIECAANYFKTQSPSCLVN